MVFMDLIEVLDIDELIQCSQWLYELHTASRPILKMRMRHQEALIGIRQ